MWVEQTLQEFGQSLGMERLAFNDQGSASLTFERLGQLYFERAEGSVLMYLARELPFASGPVLRKALAMCHYREHTPYPLQAGLRQNQLVFLLRLPEQEFILTQVEQALQYLDRMHQRVAETEL